MPFPEDLQLASYRGAFFFVSSTTTTGGRKDSLKEIVNSDRQLVEDLGLRKRTFAISGFIAQRTFNDGSVLFSYEEIKQDLLDALEGGRAGVLIHPFFGSIARVVCRTFTLNESMTSLGLSPITMTFTISDTTGLPIAEDAVLGTVASESEAASDALEERIEDDFSVLDTVADVFTAGIDKVNAAMDAVKKAVAPIVQLADQINQFSADVASIQAEAASLVAAPAALAESIRSVVDSMNALFATPEGIFDSMKRLFDFGDLDLKFTTDTASGNRRQKNQDTLSNAMQGFGLANAYTAAAQLDLPTVEELDETQQILEDQYQKMVDADTLNSDAQEGLTKTRIALSKFFDAQRAVKPREITINVNPVPARVLAYQYYGTSDDGNAIAELNGFDDAAHLSGDIRILTS